MTQEVDDDGDLVVHLPFFLPTGKKNKLKNENVLGDDLPHRRLRVVKERDKLQRLFSSINQSKIKEIQVCPKDNDVT